MHLKGSGNETSDRLRDLATSAVLEKAIEDRLKKEENRGAAQSDAGVGGVKRQADSDEGATDHGDDAEDSELSRLRERRIQQIKAAAADRKKESEMGYGEYTMIDEEDFLNTVTKCKRCVCHFFHREFERCKIMDRHLSVLAQQYDRTRFIKMDVTKAPFFVAKLAIRTLPTVVLFVDGVAVHRIVGFEELGGVDTFSSRQLAKIMHKHQVITQKLVGDESGRSNGDDEN
ncbi:unnamed protein product [Vitrella brassicaformis CCMP3155]|uniref:Thioredoxin domain-containing protein n=2 Tax=Vitrella brassicaformis TaxID=1169539 RepID=A0A0G4EQH0_VITBC|nr:unnamed protein product [Vitrella brassicaformis CCMP3155]|mmetsp:Transcript_32718/g.81041  ORF Transcript_32718/g.81041 Transcript_32718/m.81041 type:complete len:230 (+) Transcript_32718:73-762(+)|eukprot:CEL99716.1 unnamed protein product [Vitrella brassicaformis CCMP3155]